MAEKYLKCPNCGAGNPEGKMFCGDCGTGLPQPPPEPSVQPTQPVHTQSPKSWLASNWRRLATVIIVIVVVLAFLGLVYTQPWSKIKVIVGQDVSSSKGVDVYIDGVLKGSVNVPSGTTVVGVWSVVVGTHTVHIESWGEDDFTYAYDVGPLSTKSVFIHYT